jgi:hypothetical protein
MLAALALSRTFWIAGYTIAAAGRGRRDAPRSVSLNDRRECCPRFVKMAAAGTALARRMSSHPTWRRHDVEE